MAVEVEGGILLLWNLRSDLVAVEVEGGILWLWKLREGSDGCGS